MSSSVYTLKRGATGAIINVTLSDASGPVNLTGYTGVSMLAQLGDATPIINVACTITDAPNGRVRYSFDSTTANVAVGTYDLEFSATDGSGEVYKFPSGNRQPFAKLIVIDSLG